MAKGVSPMKTAGTSVRTGFPADDVLRKLPPAELGRLLDGVIASWPRDGIPDGPDPIMADIIARAA